MPAVQPGAYFLHAKQVHIWAMSNSLREISSNEWMHKEQSSYPVLPVTTSLVSPSELIFLRSCRAEFEARCPASMIEVKVVRLASLNGLIWHMDGPGQPPLMLGTSLHSWYSVGTALIVATGSSNVMALFPADIVMGTPVCSSYDQMVQKLLPASQQEPEDTRSNACKNFN